MAEFFIFIDKHYSASVTVSGYFYGILKKRGQTSHLVVPLKFENSFHQSTTAMNM